MTAKPAATPQSSVELPVEAVQARRFEKARSAQATAVLEDYVELIDDLLASGGEARPTDIARRLGVTHATAIKTITRLKREGLATSKLYRGVFLTPEGHGLADRVRARHRLVVDLLRAVGVPSNARNSMPRASSIMCPMSRSTLSHSFEAPVEASGSLGSGRPALP